MDILKNTIDKITLDEKLRDSNCKPLISKATTKAGTSIDNIYTNNWKNVTAGVVVLDVEDNRFHHFPIFCTA